MNTTKFTCIIEHVYKKIPKGKFNKQLTWTHTHGQNYEILKKINFKESKSLYKFQDIKISKSYKQPKKVLNTQATKLTYFKIGYTYLPKVARPYHVTKYKSLFISKIYTKMLLMDCKNQTKYNGDSLKIKLKHSFV